jgi:hypothetical protein
VKTETLVVDKILADMIDGVSATGQEGVRGMVQDGALAESMMEADRGKGQRRAAKAEKSNAELQVQAKDLRNDGESV